MRELFRTVPNQVSAARLALLPVLWALALLRLPAFLAAGLLLSYISDILDGYLARRLNQTSALGSKLDSLADNLTMPCVLIWLGMLRPEVYSEHPLLWVAAIGLYLGSLVLGLVKFRRFANLHLDSKKTGSVPMMVFVVHTFIAAQYSPLLLYLALGFFIFSSAEGLLIQLISPQVDEHMHSLWRVWRRQSKA